MKLLFKLSAALVCVLATLPALAAGWQPSQPIELIVPAGQGGGADQMARLIQEIVASHKLTPQPINVLNKPDQSGAEGFLLVKGNRGNAHQLIVTLSNLFTTPISTGADFNWRDMTPIAMMALDEFVLWVNADSPYRSAKQYLAAVHAAPGKFKMGGTGSKQEDELVTHSLERAADVKFEYVPLKGGGAVATALANKEISSSVNNPIEAIELWRAGKVRPLGVFDTTSLAPTNFVTDSAAWSDIPTMKSQGYSVEYLMLRGIFAAKDIPAEARSYYVELMHQVTLTPEWRTYLQRGALRDKFVTGGRFESWLIFTETVHQMLFAKR